MDTLYTYVGWQWSAEGCTVKEVLAEHLLVIRGDVEPLLEGGHAATIAMGTANITPRIHYVIMTKQSMLSLVKTPDYYSPWFSVRS